MLQISNTEPIGVGDDRAVYRHPGESRQCIKIAKCNFNKDFRIQGVRDRLFYLSRLGRMEYFDYNFNDVLYAEALAARSSDEVFRHLPRCFGWVDTDLGKGVAWELLTDFDGSLCATLKDCSFNPGLLGHGDEEEERQILKQALNEFFAWQIHHAIMLREMAYINTHVCRLDPDTIRLYHIDAIGCVDLFPLASHARWFSRLRVRSKVHQFRKKMETWLGPLSK